MEDERPTDTSQAGLVPCDTVQSGIPLALYLRGGMGCNPRFLPPQVPRPWARQGPGSLPRARDMVLQLTRAVLFPEQLWLVRFQKLRFQARDAAGDRQIPYQSPGHWLQCPIRCHEDEGGGGFTADGAMDDGSMEIPRQSFDAQLLWAGGV